LGAQFFSSRSLFEHFVGARRRSPLGTKRRHRTSRVMAREVTISQMHSGAAA